MSQALIVSKFQLSEQTTLWNSPNTEHLVIISENWLKAVFSLLVVFLWAPEETNRKCRTRSNRNKHHINFRPAADVQISNPPRSKRVDSHFHIGKLQTCRRGGGGVIFRKAINVTSINAAVLLVFGLLREERVCFSVNRYRNTVKSSSGSLMCILMVSLAVPQTERRQATEMSGELQTWRPVSMETHHHY